ncbi:hypothetical protein GPAL_4016 [Glaciecola pallidula DSM 14239 = ACAM 615]|uniref:Secreted protein n=1 Tax=Brumicola pallidula DSM 14239 = ACAM 615 TaxID=1121922 RepID=K7A5X6_9ALTE|nr:hypothetical protein GPAL_4016 [Glaciecola pallidula DSM 14239 = ACAM 615]
MMFTNDVYSMLLFQCCFFNAAFSMLLFQCNTESTAFYALQKQKSTVFQHVPLYSMYFL